MTCWQRASRGEASPLVRCAQGCLDVASVVLPGQIRLVVVLNGAGKTTLMLVLLGMLRPDKGRAFILGRDVSRNTCDSWRRRLGHMVSAPLGYPKLDR